jgi:hypothetical protein
MKNKKNLKNQKDSSKINISEKTFTAIDEKLDLLSQKISEFNKQGKNPFPALMLMRHTKSQRILLKQNPSKDIINQVKKNIKQIESMLLQMEKDSVENIRTDFFKRE